MNASQLLWGPSRQRARCPLQHSCLNGRGPVWTRRDQGYVGARAPPCSPSSQPLPSGRKPVTDFLFGRRKLQLSEVPDREWLFHGTEKKFHRRPVQRCFSESCPASDTRGLQALGEACPDTSLGDGGPRPQPFRAPLNPCSCSKPSEHPLVPTRAHTLGLLPPRSRLEVWAGHGLTPCQLPPPRVPLWSPGPGLLGAQAEVSLNAMAAGTPWGVEDALFHIHTSVHRLP